MRCSQKWTILMDSISILLIKPQTQPPSGCLNRLHSVTIASLTSINRANIFPSYAASSKNFYSFPLRPLIPISIHLRNPKTHLRKGWFHSWLVISAKDKNGLLKKKCLFIRLDAIMIKWEKIDFWVVPMISIGMCLLSEVIDKNILAILFCIFASIKVQQNQFGNQVWVI